MVSYSGISKLFCAFKDANNIKYQLGACMHACCFCCVERVLAPEISRLYSNPSSEIKTNVEISIRLLATSRSSFAEDYFLY